MEDPYYEVKSEVESSLQQLTVLLSSYARLQRTHSNSTTNNYTNSSSSSAASSEVLSYSEAELLALLSALENDVEELQEALELVEQDHLMSQRLGITQVMLKERRSFVERVQHEMRSARKQLPLPKSHQKSSVHQLNRTRRPGGSGYEKEEEATFHPLKDGSSEKHPRQYRGDGKNDHREEQEEEDPNAEFELQHQSLLIEQQDQTLTSISGTVEQLRAQAWTMGQEVYDQNEMLDELDREIDSTSSRLERAQKKMDKFIAANKSSPSSWAIFGLIIILSILLFIILFL